MDWGRGLCPCPGPGTYHQTFQELASLGELIAVGTLIPADGSHKHRDGHKEALFQGLILCRPGPRAQIRLRAQELMGRARGEAKDTISRCSWVRVRGMWQRRLGWELVGWDFLWERAPVRVSGV